MERPIDAREAVGVFDDYDQLQYTIVELEESGFGRHEISVLGSATALREKFGSMEVDPRALEDDPAAPRSANIAPEELGIAQGLLIGGFMLAGVLLTLYAGGSLLDPGLMVLTLCMAGLGGMAIGAELAEYLEENYRRFFNRQIEKGGLVLWVRTPSAEKETRAQTILAKNGAHDVHIHGIAA